MTTPAAWLVWSFEHDAWWAPNERGYTRDVTRAGRYSQARAEEIVRHENLHSREPNEAMLPDNLAMAVVRSARE